MIMDGQPRRSFLRACLQCVAALSLLTFPGCTAPTDVRRQARALTGWIPPSKSVKSLGGRYLALVREEDNLATLVRLITHDTEEKAFLQLLEHDRDGLRRRLHESHLEDFRHGHTIDVGRWILSRTEARLCALVALLDQQNLPTTAL